MASIGRALARDVKLLLPDEALGGLAPATMGEIEETPIEITIPLHMQIANRTAPQGCIVASAERMPRNGPRSLTSTGRRFVRS